MTVASILTIAVLVLLSVGALTLWIYNFLSGRDFFRDLVDKRRLVSLTLQECDELWASNPRQSDVIVSLTTMPTRIDRVADALKSLMTQSVRPQRIRLNVPDYSIREKRPYVVPGELKGLLSLEIVHCRDHGPATKLIPSLADSTLADDQLILVVDDDMLYPPDMIETLAAYAVAHPDRAVAMSGWIVPDDLTDHPTTLIANVFEHPHVPAKCSRVREPRQIDILQGYSGYMIRKRFFDLEEVTDYSEAPPEATWVDDVWLSAHCQAPKFVIPYRRYPGSFRRNDKLFTPGSLGRLNQGGGDPADRNNTIVVRHLSDRWMNAARTAGTDQASRR